MSAFDTGKPWQQHQYIFIWAAFLLERCLLVRGKLQEKQNTPKNKFWFSFMEISHDLADINCKLYLETISRKKKDFSNLTAEKQNWTWFNLASLNFEDLFRCLHIHLEFSLEIPSWWKLSFTRELQTCTDSKHKRLCQTDSTFTLMIITEDSSIQWKNLSWAQMWLTSHQVRSTVRSMLAFFPQHCAL